jgi:hypothetical protein
MSNIINPYRFSSSGGGGGSDYVTISTSATVNTDSYDYDYKYIEFDSTATSAFEVTDAGSSSGSDSIEVYVIGGGGAGSGPTSGSNVGASGGGGAGGYIRQTAFTNASSLLGTYDVTVGAGGTTSGGTSNTAGADSQVRKQTDRSIDIASGDYFSADASSNFDFGTGDYTVEFWMKTDLSVNTSNWQLPISVGSMQFWISTGSKYLSPYWGTSSIIQTSNNVLRDDYWQHIALTRESGTTRIYVDGVHRGSTTTSTDFGTSGSNKVTFGYQLYVGGGYFTMAGKFAGIRIYKGTAKYTGTSGFNPNMEKPVKETNVTLLINPDSGQSDITDSSDGSNSFTDNITWSSDLETDTPLMRAFGGGAASSYSGSYTGDKLKGGSGGGGSYSLNTGPVGFNGQGNKGGDLSTSDWYAGGGGGADSAGYVSSGTVGGYGGDALAVSWMANEYLGYDGDGMFAGGGGGGGGASGPSSGGGGGAGDGGYASDYAYDAEANSGGGGGGDRITSASGGTGGSGKVIVRWKYQN